MTAAQIISKFGGIRAMQRALGHSNPTNVQYWGKEGHWPRWRCNEIYAAAKRKRLGIKAEEIEAVARNGVRK